MAETTKPIKHVMVDYVCDACGLGKMRPTGMQLMSNPPQYPHQCTYCNHLQNFRGITYPHQRAVEE